MRGSAVFRAAVAPGGVLAGPWVKNELWRRARAVPSLDLQFADNKSLVDATTGASLVTFTRASSGTYVDSQGVIKTAATNEARFDHNPTTGESLGLLVEEQRTNLLLRSEEFDNASWPKLACSVSMNTTTAPDGLITADTLIESTTNAEHVTYQSRTGSNETVTLTIFAKAKERTRARIGFSNFLNEGRGAIYDLQAGTVVSTDANGTDYTSINASIQSCGNGWYRCRFTATKGNVNTNNTPFIEPVLGTSFSYTGDGTSGIYIWGAQLEVGAFPTSYIPTTTAAVTRSADVASIAGSNFSSWYRQDEGTVFADVNTASVANIAQGIFDLSEGAGNERIFQRRNTGSFIVTAITDNGVVQGDFGSVSVSASSRARSGLAYRLNDLESAVNGNSSGTDTSATIPAPDRIHIGQNFASGQVINGTIRRLTYWPTRLANNVLQEITR